jgi:hypothetical protein
MLELMVVMEANVVRKSIMVSAAVHTTMIWSALVGEVDDIVSWVREHQAVNTAVVVVKDKRQLTVDGSGVNGDIEGDGVGGAALPASSAVVVVVTTAAAAMFGGGDATNVCPKQRWWC